jgi:3-ketosteroid 9alpha-monooxygenase subunit A
MYQHGWYQVAFERDLSELLTPIEFAGRRLMGVKTSNAIRVVDATCPHRGAHLAYGGKVDGDVIVCPFHGHRIGLGNISRREFCVDEYRSCVLGGMVFIRLSSADVPDLPLALEELLPNRTFFPGFIAQAATDLDIAAENALDCSHFKTVHGLLNEPVFKVRTGSFGELVAEGDFEVPGSQWSERQGSLGSIMVKYQARAFSPGVVISELRGQAPYNYTIVSTGTPGAQPHTCTLRLTVALAGDGGPPNQQFARELLQASLNGVEQDTVIWNRLSLDRPPRWTSRDKPLVQFSEFCSRFRTDGSPGS